jgi:uncharacterized UPF0160 family protein
MTTKTTTHTFLHTTEAKALSVADNGGWLYVSHDGLPHADDVSACVAWALGVIPADVKICWVLRTRNQALIEALSGRPNVIIADVGGRFDPARNIFDHHFKNCEKREDGLPYSSFGLIVRHISGIEAANAQMVRHIDAIDNGVKGYDAPAWWPRFNKQDPNGGSVAWAVHHASPCHDDGSPVTDEEFNSQFCRLALQLEKVFTASDKKLQKDGLPFTVQCFFEAAHAATERARVHSRKRVAKLADAPVMCLPQFEVAALDYLAELPEDALVKFLVYPGPGGRQWMVQQIPKAVGAFEGRLQLPASWAGLRGEDLAKVTGVEDAVFCHPGRFIGGAKSKEGALKLAELALEAEVKRLEEEKLAAAQKAQDEFEAAQEATKAEAAQAEVQS